MLTAKGDDIDRILGLELGADDYLPKPFNPRELIARIRAILRRVEERGQTPSRVDADDIAIDVERREARFQGKPLALTTVEFAILEVLVRNVGRVLSREFLTDAAMGRGLGFADRTVDVHISNLRKKLSTNRGVERIKTVRYFGTAAARISDEQGPAVATTYLANLSRDVRIRACLFDLAAKVVAGTDCETFGPMIHGVQQGASSEFSMPNGTVRIAVRIVGGNQEPLFFASELPVAPRAMLQTNVPSLLLRGGFALFVSGWICFALARFLTRPVLNLRLAAQQITAGDLSIRADERLAKRRDELGDLVQDFNCMADTNQRVISRQRQLLYDISHELRSPLTRMNVAIDLLRGRVGEDAALTRIEADTERLNELIGRLLTVTKLENTATLLNTTRLELIELVRSIASDADFEAQKSGSQVRVVSGSGISMQGDYGLLRSAIENVVRNAVRHTAPGTSVDINVSGRDKSDSGYVTVTVRDYGTGVPEKELHNIFEPFYRVIDADRDDDGVGLGLSITDRVIRLHKGTITASNATPGSGLLVTLRLPLAQQAG